MRCLGNLGLEIQTTQFFLNRNVRRAFFQLSNDVQVISTEKEAQKFKLTLKPMENFKARLVTHWSVKAASNLQIIIELADEHNQFLPPGESIPVMDVVKELNSSTFMGTYFVKPQQPQMLCFKYRVPIVILRNYLSGTIGQIYEQISYKFTWFVSKVCLVGGNPKIKSRSVYDALINLQHLKEQFEINRLGRKNAIKEYDLMNSSMKVVDDALKLISYQHGLLNHYKTGVMNSEKRKKCLRISSKVSDALNKYQLTKLKQTTSNSIVSGIEVNGTLSQKKIGEGGFSQIYKGQYLVSLYPTINPKLYSSIRDINAQPMQQRTLVRKTFKPEGDRQSHENQINFLTYIRNQRHPLVSAYFLPAFQRQEEVQQENSNSIFMEYYQKNLYEASSTWKLLHPRIQASLQIFNGIYFLHQNGILHRDIKEINLLVQNKKNLKMIDFGSTCEIYHEKPTAGTFKAISKELKSTKNYYFSFRQLQTDYPMIAQKFSREQYEQAETFDVYSAGTILTNLFRLNNQIFDTIYHNHLNFLASKCHQRNPEDRYTPKEALCYIFSIKQLYKAVNNLEISSEKQLKPDVNIRPFGDLFE